MTVRSAPNSTQELTRGRFVGPPAVPARESSQRGDVTAVADRALPLRRTARQPPRRIGFGTGAPSQLSVKR